MKHAHVDHAGDELAAAAAATLVRAGEQWTPMRAAVFAVLGGTGRPLSAYDIADAIARGQNRRVAPNSVYRILDLFVANNLATRVESLNAYVANPHPGCVHDCIFLICDACSATRHVDDDAVARSLRRSARSDRFAPSRTVIEVRGRCGECG